MTSSLCLFAILLFFYPAILSVHAINFQCYEPFLWFFHFSILYCTDGSNSFIRNVSIRIPDCTMSFTFRQAKSNKENYILVVFNNYFEILFISIAKEVLVSIFPVQWIPKMFDRELETRGEEKGDSFLHKRVKTTSINKNVNA